MGNAAARHGSTVMCAPSSNLRMWSWQVAVPSSGPCGRPLIIIEHPARMTHASVAGSPLAVDPALVRCSVGLETAEDLVEDLRQALDQVA